MLSDQGIIDAMKAGLVIEPFDMEFLQPCSYDVHLAQGVLLQAFDASPTHCRKLVAIQERIEIPDWLHARIEGKSTIGRLYVLVQCTAGFVDAGFSGHLTLEMVNLDCVPHRFEAGDAIAQITFTKLDTPAIRPYGHSELGSHYQNQEMKGVPAWTDRIIPTEAGLAALREYQTATETAPNQQESMIRCHCGRPINHRGRHSLPSSD